MPYTSSAQRYAAPVQVDGGGDGQVRALLAGEPADVDQAQDVVAPARSSDGSEGGQVDAERDPVDGGAGGCGDLANSRIA